MTQYHGYNLELTIIRALRHRAATYRPKDHAWVKWNNLVAQMIEKGEIEIKLRDEP